MAAASAHRYARFLIDTVKPRIDAQYRTRRNRESRAIVGSSMGGLISLYAFFLRRPRRSDASAAMSPSIWFGGRRLLEYVEQAGAPRGRIYLDTGTAEGRETLRNTRALARLLRRKGYGAGTLRYVEAHGHGHTETDWASRLPEVLQFLLE